MIYGFSRQVIKPLLCLVFCTLFSLTAHSRESNWFQNKIKAFKDSNLQFGSSDSHVPFMPLFSVSGKTYKSSDIDVIGQKTLEYDQSSISQYAVLPFLVDDNNAFFVGEYLSRANFNAKNDNRSQSFHVDSIGVPAGWVRQVNRQSQAYAFVMPVAHKSSAHNSDWNWQYLGVVFGRYVQSDKLWWAYGLYADISDEEDVYLPYMGASWQVNRHWTVSAIMPWPAVRYAPNDDWVFSLGASPSGASWRASDLEKNEYNVNYDAWDFGLSAETHLAGNVWFSVATGLGGLRGLRISGSHLEEPSSPVSSSLYFSMAFRYRPSLRNVL